MNNEPVAWAYILDGGDFMDAIHPEEHNRHEGNYTTPLYTTPQDQADRIAELEKEKKYIKNEWINGLVKIAVMERSVEVVKELTPQIKELSDEEIREVIRKHWNRELGNRGMLALCKAVLEKASTKCG